MSSEAGAGQLTTRIQRSGMQEDECRKRLRLDRASGENRRRHKHRWPRSLCRARETRGSLPEKKGNTMLTAISMASCQTVT